MSFFYWTGVIWWIAAGVLLAWFVIGRALNYMAVRQQRREVEDFEKAGRW